MTVALCCLVLVVLLVVLGPKEKWCGGEKSCSEDQNETKREEALVGIFFHLW